MRTRKVTYADLDAFLHRLGLARREVEVDHGRADDGGNGAVDAALAPTPVRRPVRGYAYEHAPTGALLMLPMRPPDEAVAPHNLHAARRTLVDWGVTSDEEFDRWLCRMRFSDVGDVTVGAAVGQVRTTG